MRTLIFFVGLVGMLLAGCGAASHLKAEKMMPLGSRLTKVTAAVEATVQYENPPAESRDQQLLKIAMAHDPKYLSRFKGYKLRVENRSGHAALLLCSLDGVNALFEDIGCTAKLDKTRWELPSPCEYTLNVEEVCLTRRP